jgi:dTMP kinase
MKKGLFLTVEGSEGVGKSTNIALIERLLSEKGIDYIKTREPGGTPLAEAVRELLLSKDYDALDAKAELLLVFAARAQHLARVILPALAQGQWVVCDRFTDATFAYQGGGRSLDVDMIKALEVMVQQGLAPDVTLLLDIDVRTGLERARGRAELDRFESESIAFFERVRAAYLERAAADPRRFITIDAGQTLEAVQKDIAEALSVRIEQWQQA